MPLNNEIRILDLLPGNTGDPVESSIRTATLGSNTPYETLSYVWGNRQCGRIVHIAGHDVEVTSNLYAALLRLRDLNTTRALWVDQLCINQWDDAEKAEQVNLMRLIYKHCSGCLIWLGEIGDGITVQDAEAAFDFIRLFAVCDNQPTPDIPPNLQIPRAIEGARKALEAMMLNGNPWWSRIWTSCSYELSAATLYTRVTLDLIQLEGTFRPLIGSRGEPHVTKGLPTWAIDMVRCEDPKRRAWSWHKQSHRYKMFNADGEEPFQWESLNEGSVLSLTGVFVDRIVEIGQTISEDNWGDISDDELIDVISAWEEVLARFVERHGTSDLSLSWRNAFWRTMLGDLIMAEYPVRRVEDADHGSFIDFRKNQSHNEIYLSVRDMLVNQAFFITENGYIGIGPPIVRARDQVWVVIGSQVPLILRQRVELRDGRVGEAGRNDYEFVGDAFVYGFMDGEAVSDLEGKQEEILLY
ncbi:hypothetical protein N431DRAFT_400268 [Stipitochalara longipes BDJ]|nr:hypothetical protein N431DRAFT_400268 [Stipitochalara longipes BDJ]